MSAHDEWTRARLSSSIQVAEESECWLWLGYVDVTGYGRTRFHKRSTRAHRVSYEVHVGPIPEGLTIDHLCHTLDATCAGGPTCVHRRCINPAHLEPVTRGENVNRAHGSAARRTHCPHGHPYDEVNTYLSRDGFRVCRACRATRLRRKADSAA